MEKLPSYQEPTAEQIQQWEREEQELLKRREIERKNQILVDIGFKSRYMKDYEPTEKQKKILELVKKSNLGFYITGSKGIGKTQTLQFIAKYYVFERNKRNMVYTDVLEIFKKIRSSEPLPNPEILFIDDFGWESPSEYALSEFVYFLKNRYSDEKTTYIMSNLTRQDMEARNSDAYNQIIDLINDKSWMYYIELSGESLRK